MALRNLQDDISDIEKMIERYKKAIAQTEEMN